MNTRERITALARSIGITADIIVCPYDVEPFNGQDGVVAVIGLTQRWGVDDAAALAELEAAMRVSVASTLAAVVPELAEAERMAAGLRAYVDGMTAALESP